MMALSPTLTRYLVSYTSLVVDKIDSLTDHSIRCPWQLNLWLLCEYHRYDIGPTLVPHLFRT